MAEEKPLTALRLAFAGATRAIAGAAAALLLAAAAMPPASTQTPLGPYRVELPTSVLLPAGPQSGSEHRLEPGESILLGRLGAASIAVTSAPISVVIADEPVRIGAGTVLPGVHVRGGALAGLEDPRVFCGWPYTPVERRGGHYYRPGNDPRFPQFVQVCVVDRDKDGRLDFAIMAGTGWPEDRVAVPLPQIPYAFSTDTPYGDGEVRLLYVRAGAGLLSPALLNLQVTAGGRDVGLTRLRLPGDDGRMRWQDWSQRVAGDVYPRTISFGQARIDILAYDPAARTVNLRLARGFARSEIVMEATTGTGTTAFRN